MAPRTHEAIVNAARTEKQRLLLIFERIENSKDEILEKQLEAPLGDGDLDELDKLSADQDVIRRALKDLSLVTVQALDRAEEVRFVLNALETARRRLTQSENRLSRFAKNAGEFATLLERLQKLADRLKAFSEA